MERGFINSKNKIKKIGSSCVPAKLIISGEHSVLYNQTALTCAINLWMKIKIKKTNNYKIVIKQSHKKEIIYVDDRFKNSTFSNPICEIYRQFLVFTDLKFYGIVIKIDTKMPSRCGLGSSASLIVGMIKALNNLYNINLSQYKMIILAKKLENIFHGKSSGIDIITIIKKGILFFNNNNIRNYKTTLNKIYVINTGSPSFSTKEVVNFVSKKYKNNETLWDDFKDITLKEKQRLISNQNISSLVNKNEKLLEKIGIVSDKTANFIKILYRYNIYAKVCGAGTIGCLDNTNNNGVIAIFHCINKKQIKTLKQLCKLFKYRLKLTEIVY